MKKPGFFRKYSYAWLTILFFLVSLGLHWLFGWYAYQDEAAQHGQNPDSYGYLVEMMRDTMENWQSEFLQLLWQVVGLAYFLYIGSPNSKENDDRMEAKLDALLRIAGGKEVEKLIDDIDEHYLRHDGHSMPYGHDSEFARSVGREVRHVAHSQGT